MMRNRWAAIVLAAAWAALLAGMQASSAAAAAEPTSPVRGLKICVAAEAPPPVRAAAQAVLDAEPRHPLLSLMADESPPRELTDSRALLAGPAAARAYDHLVLVGLVDDPLLRAAWQREARIDKEDWYIFGFGHLRGTLGYVESDRNPFLHGVAIALTPFETQVVTLTGSNPEGVRWAVDAFLRLSLVNGVVAGKIDRPQQALLERRPLPPDFGLPDWPPAEVAGLRRIGVTQASEDEYRGVLQDTGVMPHVIWRFKYYVPGAWDGGGQARAFDHYAGLHRRSSGNTLWMAQFATAAAARDVAPKIAAAAKLARDGNHWQGPQPPQGYQNEPAGPLVLWQRDAWLILSTLPPAATRSLCDAP